MSERLSESARTALAAANRATYELGHDALTAAHLLVGALIEGSSVSAHILYSYGMTPSTARARLAAVLPVASGDQSRRLRFDPTAEEALREGWRYSLAVRANDVSVDMLCLAILRASDPLVGALLAGYDLTAGDLVRDIRAALTSAATAVSEAVIDSERTNEPGLTGMMSSAPFDDATDTGGGLPPVVANHPSVASPGPMPRGALSESAKARRAAEPIDKSALGTFGVNLTRAAHLGHLDPLIGRAAEIEQMIMVLCRRAKNNPVLVGDAGVGKTAIVEGLAQRIASGNIPELLTGKQLWSLDLGALIAGTTHRGMLEQRWRAVIAEASMPDVILFIDEIHSLSGLGRTSGSLGVSDMLKPVLVRGDLSVIGATTGEEYRLIEADAALERRFTPVRVKASSPADTKTILAGLRDVYEAYHHVEFSDAALSAAVDLSVEHLPQRQLPDKAIDVLDEAGAAAVMHRAALGVEKSAWFVERYDWSKLATEAAAEGDDEDFAAATSLVAELDAKIGDLAGLLTVSAADVAAIVSDWSGVEARAAGDDEITRLLAMESILTTRVVGQDAAVSAVSRAVRRRRSRIADRSRPTSFLFAGPSGVGKTETAKALAEYLFGSDSKLVTFDMSEYMEQNSVARLIGAPPGYVGHGEGGLLTEAVRRAPAAVLLFDEVDKAHPQVLDVLLSLLEDGHVTDASGRRTDFSRTIVIMTSNLGSSDMAKATFGFATSTPADAAKRRASHVEAAVKTHLRPELINRIDEIVTFDTLSVEVVASIVERLLVRLRAQLAERDVTLALAPAAVAYLVAAGYDPLMGARPLRRAIQIFVENRLAEGLLDGSVRPGTDVVVDMGVDGPVLVVTERVAPERVVAEALPVLT